MVRRRSIGRAIAFVGCLLASSTAWSYGIHNGQVVNDAGRPLRLRGLNWFGFETGEHVVQGLWARNWKDMIGQMQQQGFNAVRLPFCPQTLHGTGNAATDWNRAAGRAAAGQFGRFVQDGHAVLLGEFGGKYGRGDAPDWRVSIGVQGAVTTPWNAVWEQTGGTLQASGVSWNRTLAPAGMAEFGFCAAR